MTSRALVVAWLAMAASGCKDDPPSFTIYVEDPAQEGPGLGFAEPYVIDEGQTLDLLVAPSIPGAEVSAAPLPANARFEGNIFTFTPDYRQAGLYGVTFTSVLGAETAVRSIAVRVRNAINIGDTPRASIDEGGSLTLTFRSEDPAGTVVAYSSSLDSSPIEGASFDPATGVLQFAPAFDYLDDYPTPTIITVRAEGTEIDSGIRRVSEARAVFDVTEVTSYALEIQRIWNTGCAFTGGCHGGSSPAGGLDLQTSASYASLVGVAPSGPDCLGIAQEDYLVTAGNPFESLAYRKMAGSQSCGARMPFECELGGAIACSTEAELRKLELWIRAGAPSN